MGAFVAKNGWIRLPIDPQLEDVAQDFRKERDEIYGNIYEEKDTDSRWVGDLGEWVFNSFLGASGINGSQWLKDQDAAGKADFILPGDFSLGVKTVKRKVTPKPSYTAQITAKHAKEPVHGYFFLCYDFVQRSMWLLGGISKEKFLRYAKYYGPGDKVHDNYTIRPGHEIYNIELKHLTPPQRFLDLALSLQQSAQVA
tara:strand:+ start:3339 stop:3932 length:594 start_codon:yes stop_codon:yes gene_type:complete